MSQCLVGNHSCLTHSLCMTAWQTVQFSWVSTDDYILLLKINWADIWIHLLILVIAAADWKCTGILRDSSFHYLTLMFDFYAEIEAGAFQTVLKSSSLKWFHIKVKIWFYRHKSAAQKVMATFILPATALKAFAFSAWIMFIPFFRSLQKSERGKERTSKMYFHLFPEIKLVTQGILCLKLLC